MQSFAAYLFFKYLITPKDCTGIPIWILSSSHLFIASHGVLQLLSRLSLFDTSLNKSNLNTPLFWISKDLGWLVFHLFFESQSLKPQNQELNPQSWQFSDILSIVLQCSGLHLSFQG